MPEMRVTGRRPWWRTPLVGFALTLVFRAVGLGQLSVVAAAVAGFLSGRGRAGAYRGIQAVAPAWVLWILAISLVAPVEDLVLILGGILGGGWGLVVLLMILVPIVLGLFGGMAGEAPGSSRTSGARNSVGSVIGARCTRAAGIAPCAR